jgi:hypothetical protein
VSKAYGPPCIVANCGWDARCPLSARQEASPDLSRGVATIKATEALASVKNVIFYMIRFVIVHYLELVMAEPAPRKSQEADAAFRKFM